MTVRIADTPVECLMLDSNVMIATFVIVAIVSVTKPFRSTQSELCGAIPDFKYVMSDSTLSEADPDARIPEAPSGRPS